MNETMTMRRALAVAHDEGQFLQSIVSTQQGLPVESIGHQTDLIDGLAALTALCDDVCLRAERDVGIPFVDEVSLRSETRKRVVVRPLGEIDGTRMYLVVEVPPKGTWRRATNRFCRFVARR